MTIINHFKGLYKLCACGCGGFVKITKWGRLYNFKSGHFQKLKSKTMIRPINNTVRCACGCGELTNMYRNYPRIYLRGHHIRGNGHPMWKGGLKHRGDGYIYEYSPLHPKRSSNNRVAQHRLIFEEYHKCCLLPFTIIHHKDRNRSNNNIENLEPMYQSNHTVHHMKGNRYGVQNIGDRICFKCKSNKTYHTNKGYEVWGKDKNGNWLCDICYGELRRTIFKQTGSWSTNKFK